jgi:hypothetical protein
MKRLIIVPVLAIAMLAASCSSGTATPTAAVAKPEITSVYDSFFNLANKSVGPKLAAIQDGSTLKTSVTQALASPLAGSVSGARVDSVKIVSDSTCTTKTVPTPCASVSYDLLAAGGSPVLSGQTGYATYATGKWLVAKATVCGLIETLYSVEGNSGTPPGCPKS